jgi:hypothetical protein
MQGGKDGYQTCWPFMLRGLSGTVQSFGFVPRRVGAVDDGEVDDEKRLIVEK